MQKSWPPIHDWQIKTWKEELDPGSLGGCFCLEISGKKNHALCDQDPCPFICYILRVPGPFIF